MWMNLECNFGLEYTDTGGRNGDDQGPVNLSFLDHFLHCLSLGTFD